MRKAPLGLQELQRRIYRKAKSETAQRFWGLFVHMTKAETLAEASRLAKRKGGAAGIDGQTCEDMASSGGGGFLAAIREDLITGRYTPQPNRRVAIPQGNGPVRERHIPCSRDRGVQGALPRMLAAIARIHSHTSQVRGARAADAQMLHVSFSGRDTFQNVR